MWPLNLNQVEKLAFFCEFGLSVDFDPQQKNKKKTQGVLDLIMHKYIFVAT